MKEDDISRFWKVTMRDADCIGNVFHNKDDAMKEACQMAVANPNRSVYVMESVQGYRIPPFAVECFVPK
jgi:hypothetical protein